jgi:hypothetical protein
MPPYYDNFSAMASGLRIWPSAGAPVQGGLGSFRPKQLASFRSGCLPIQVVDGFWYGGAICRHACLWMLWWLAATLPSCDRDAGRSPATQKSARQSCGRNSTSPFRHRSNLQSTVKPIVCARLCKRTERPCLISRENWLHLCGRRNIQSGGPVGWSRNHIL